MVVRVCEMSPSTDGIQGQVQVVFQGIKAFDPKEEIGHVVGNVSANIVRVCHGIVRLVGDEAVDETAGHPELIPHWE
jgi:hypothetical protein